MLLYSSISVHSQCIQNPNFNLWEDEGDSAAAWSAISSGTQAFQNYNTNYPSFFVGPDTLINVHISGKFKVNTSSDDDYIGFVFGYQEPTNFSWMGNPPFNASLTNSCTMDFYLFDWKKSGQTYSGYTAQEGFSLDKVNGTFAATTAGVFPSFWVHTNSTSFNVLQTLYSTTNGWVAFQTYEFDLYYAPTRAVILIDSDTIFDQSGCFEPGRFGFYNYSQNNSLYWDFNYELFIEFDMEAEDVCFGDTSKFIFIDTGSCYNANSFSNLDTFYWDLGDSTITNDTNPWHIYTDPGIYTVMLIATDINGCTDTAMREIFIHGEPIAEIGYANVCKGDTMLFGDSTSLPYGNITFWAWDFGDGNTASGAPNPQHLYNQSGTYDVKLYVVDNAGCLDSVITPVEVYPNPIPSFTIDDACDGQDVHLENASLQALASIISYEWDVESNGSVDYISTNVDHEYSTFGTYAVKLKVSDSLGCRDSLVQLAIVHPMPNADFDAPPVCYNDVMTFNDSSEIATGNITNWAWDFGDGFTSTSANPTHLYLSPGQHQVKLKVTSDGGCQDSVTKTVTVYHLPVALFETTPECENLAASFVQTSTSQNGNLSIFEWNFGDGGSSFSSGPLHDYNGPGLYQVTLRVETQFGCEDTAMRSIRIYPAPDAAFGWKNNVCEGDDLPIYDQSVIAQATPGGDQVVAWNWNVNGTMLNAQHPLYTTSIHENLNVFLIVKSNYGCIDSARNFPEIYPIPEPAFEFIIGCEDRESSFKDLSTISVGLVDDWLWDFGDGNQSDLADPIHSYDLAGNYEVKLSISSNKGCKSAKTRSLYVPETPRVNFNLMPSTGCSPLITQGVNLSELNTGSMNYRWSVNGSFYSSEKNPKIYLENDTLAPISFEIGLKVTTDAGCENQKNKQEAVWVYPTPKAKFISDRQSINLFEPVILFENRSEHSVRWLWNFDDGRTSTNFSPAHEFANAGKYQVVLTSWNEYNCSDTTMDIINLDPITTLYIPNAFTPNGDGNNDVWSVQGFNENQGFKINIWDRWGQQIFFAESMNFSWDGKTSDNKLAPNGVYVYDILYQTSEGDVKEVHGEFTLVR